jgi:hypothetical protein
VAQGRGPEFKPQYHKTTTTKKISSQFFKEVVLENWPE